MTTNSNTEKRKQDAAEFTNLAKSGRAAARSAAVSGNAHGGATGKSSVALTMGDVAGTRPPKKKSRELEMTVEDPSRAKIVAPTQKPLEKRTEHKTQKLFVPNPDTQEGAFTNFFDVTKQIVTTAVGVADNILKFSRPDELDLLTLKDLSLIAEAHGKHLQLVGQVFEAAALIFQRPDMTKFGNNQKAVELNPAPGCSVVERECAVEGWTVDFKLGKDIEDLEDNGEGEKEGSKNSSGDKKDSSGDSSSARSGSTNGDGSDGVSIKKQPSLQYSDWKTRNSDGSASIRSASANSSNRDNSNRDEAACKTQHKILLPEFDIPDPPSPVSDNSLFSDVGSLFSYNCESTVHEFMNAHNDVHEFMNTHSDSNSAKRLFSAAVGAVGERGAYYAADGNYSDRTRDSRDSDRDSNRTRSSAFSASDPGDRAQNDTSQADSQNEYKIPAIEELLKMQRQKMRVFFSEGESIEHLQANLSVLEPFPRVPTEVIQNLQKKNANNWGDEVKRLNARKN